MTSSVPASSRASSSTLSTIASYSEICAAFENEAGIGGGILRGVFEDGLKVAGVGHDDRVFSLKNEMITHAIIQAQMSVRAK